MAQRGCSPPEMLEHHQPETSTFTAGPRKGERSVNDG